MVSLTGRLVDILTSADKMWRHRLEHCGQLKSEGQELTALKTEIQTLYSTHRVTRNAQQKEKFLSCDFNEVIIDPFLLRIERPEFAEPGFADPRYCLVFWARPPDHVIRLAAHLQTMLREAAPSKLHSSCCTLISDVAWVDLQLLIIKSSDVVSKSSSRWQSKGGHWR